MFQAAATGCAPGAARTARPPVASRATFCSNDIIRQSGRCSVTTWASLATVAARAARATRTTADLIIGDRRVGHDQLIVADEQTPTRARAAGTAGAAGAPVTAATTSARRGHDTTS